MDAPLSGQERPRFAQGAMLSKHEGHDLRSVTRIPDLVASVGAIFKCSCRSQIGDHSAVLELHALGMETRPYCIREWSGAA